MALFCHTHWLILKEFIEIPFIIDLFLFDQCNFVQNTVTYFINFGEKWLNMTPPPRDINRLKH